jgi:hypothetical protein
LNTYLIPERKVELDVLHTAGVLKLERYLQKTPPPTSTRVHVTQKRIVTVKEMIHVTGSLAGRTGRIEKNSDRH